MSVTASNKKTTYHDLTLTKDQIDLLIACMRLRLHELESNAVWYDGEGDPASAESCNRAGIRVASLLGYIEAQK